MATITPQKQKIQLPKLTLVEYPAESLLKPSIEVELNDESKQYVMQLFELFFHLKKYIGPSIAGLAAPQTGRNWRIFIANSELFINPKLLGTTSKAPQDVALEGCLSLPFGKFWKVGRAPTIWLGWQKLDGSWEERKFNGMNARVIQHELDHLEGKLCCGEDYPTKEKEDANRPA